MRVLVAGCVMLVICSVTLTGVAGTGSPASAAAAPTCKFTGPAVGQLVGNITPGESVNVFCKGFPANNPYLLVTTSLLVAINPAAKPLLTGQVETLPGILALISALPEMNAQSVELPFSNSSGVLNTNYTVPTSQALDPNAVCPPTKQQFNSGLIGCAVAMIDVLTGKPVVEGTFLLNYKTQPLFPPDPTVQANPAVGTRGHRETLSDANGATSYWWLATLVSVFNNLSGGTSTGSVPVVLRVGGRKVPGGASVAAATYNNDVTFTPPRLSGSFIAKKAGHEAIQVTLDANLLGNPLSIAVKTKLKVLP